MYWPCHVARGVLVPRAGIEPGPLQWKRCTKPWAAGEAPDTASWTVGSTCAAHNRWCLRAMPLSGGVNNHAGIGGADGRPARPLLRVCLEGGLPTPARAAPRDLGSSVPTLLGRWLSRWAPSTKLWWPDSVRLLEVR